MGLMDRRQAMTTLTAASFVPVRDASAAVAANSNWKQILAERLPLYGHRNWIVVADSAYPAQSRDGIETVLSNEDHFEVLRVVRGALAASKHVSPIVYQDHELKFVPEKDAPGVENCRRELSSLFKGEKVQVMPHEQIIAKLDQAGQTFRILIIKTTLTVPYTTVFFQLGCAYWSEDAEQRLRAAMGSQG